MPLENKEEVKEVRNEGYALGGFKALVIRPRHQQNFDKDNITIKKAGKQINVYQMIQENREDTEIYPTLEKYGSIERLQLNAQGAYGDFTQIKDLRTAIDQAEKANELWETLPLDTRREFQNNKKLFLENGEEYLKKLATKEKEKEEANKVVEVKEQKDA